MLKAKLIQSGIVLGIISLVIAVFVPWLQLSSTILREEQQGFSPWNTLVSGNASSLPLVGYIFIVLLAGILFSTVRWLTQRDTRTASRSKIWLILSGFAILVLVGVTLIILPTGLALTYPYYDVMLGSGGWLAGVGALLVIMCAIVAL